MIEKMGGKEGHKAIKLDQCQLKLQALLGKYAKKIKAENNRGLFKRVRSFIAPKKVEHRGAYIYGAVGRGKSMLLREFFDSIDTKRKAFIHFHVFMDKFHVDLNKLNGNSEETSEDHLDSIVSDVAKNYSVLILDELQINNISDAMIVGRLFKGLIEKGVFVFFSSNRPPEDLFKDGLQRDRFVPFISYVKRRLDVFELNNYMDYRLDILGSVSDSYFCPINKKTRTDFTVLVTRVVGGHELIEEDVKVGPDRVIKVLRSYGNIAVFSFKELCEIPLGARDYMALCQNFNTIIIENIPKMSSENHNEALRFITLIDCMYNSSTSLICTAEAEPNELYSNGRNSFEFQRTASRLSEMRSYDYRNMVRESH